jgi:hypothetical protein
MTEEELELWTKNMNGKIVMLQAEIRYKMDWIKTGVWIMYALAIPAIIFAALALYRVNKLL